MTRARAAALCAACLVAGACQRAPATFTISVVGTNDLHGGILEENGRGGLALLDGYLANLRAARQADGGAVLLLDAGDLFQGTLESNLNEGAVVVDAYNAIGYQAATIGNHEFDYGPVGPAAIARAPGDDPRGALKARLSQARFPWVAANLLDANTREPVRWPNVAPSTTVIINGIRIGVVGLLTREALTATLTSNVSDLAMAPLDITLIQEATRLRQTGATIVVAVAHAGGSCSDGANPGDLSSCGPDEIFNVARAVPAGLVDAIVGGHRHARIAHVVNGIAIIESGSGGRAFGRADLIVDRASGRVTAHRVFAPQELCARQVRGQMECAAPSAPDAEPAEYEGRPVAPGAKITEILKPAVSAAAATKARPLGTATMAASLGRDTDPRNAVGDVEADWFKALIPDADAAITNTGGLRADLPEGPLTYGRLYALMPFDNLRVVITLSGAELRAVIGENAKASGSMIAISGVRATVACHDDGLKVELWRDSGKAIGEAEKLKIVTTDFLATGGDKFFSPVMPLHVESSGGPIRDEMADMLARVGGSWGAERLPPRIDVKGSRPLTCKTD